jgi:exosortase F-associated protein
MMSSKRLWIGFFAIVGLLLLFIFQKFNYAQVVGISSHLTQFIFNRTVRFFLNDSLAILLIYALFQERKYVLFAFWVQAIGFLFLLLPYFVIKIYLPDYNGPLLNFLHRIIVNPTLMLLLIPALAYQKKMANQ